MSVAAVVRELRESDEDFEWYPTTEEIIRKVTRDMIASADRRHHEAIKSILDIGAGDGRVLLAMNEAIEKSGSFRLRDGAKLYAIEKAIPHLNNMPKEISVIGTDFHEQALVDKPVSVLFCNPPYSEYEWWVSKILRETCADTVYLVIPRRWADSQEIDLCLKKRKAEVKSLGEFDFSNADRKARARVEVLRIEFAYENRSAFNSVIEEMLPELDVFNADLEADNAVKYDSEVIVGDQNLVEVLTSAYHAELAEMIENYKAVLKIKPRVLKEVGVNRTSVLDGIRLKVKGLKDKYWQTLFSEMKSVTQRLATKQRKAFLSSLQEKVSVDFTANNVYAILIWVSKWANDYFDEQLIELFRNLSEGSCVVKYKSNDRVWTKGDWRYSQFSREDDNKPSHYKLEYRMVLTRGGISVSPYDWERHKNLGLTEHALELLMDIVTVSNNLGFASNDSPRNYEWVSNKQNTLLLSNGQPLVAVRAFKNGNMHMHFNPKVMLAINVEAGRLLKWIRNPAEACAEMGLLGDEAKQAAKMFGSSFRISPESGVLRIAMTPTAVAETVTEAQEMTVAEALAEFDMNSLLDEMFS